MRRYSGVLLFCAALWAFLAPTAPALELSLEENRAQRGSVGHIDMSRVFALFPETIRAKETFQEAVRQAEERVNLRKGGLMRLRAEVLKIQAERDVLAEAITNAPPPAPPQTPPAQAPAPAAAPPTPPEIPAAGIPLKPGGEDVLLPPAGTPPSSAGASTAQGTSEDLPGFPPPQGAAHAAPSGQAPAAPIVTSTVTAPPPPPDRLPEDKKRVQALERTIADKTAEIARREEDLKILQSAAEKNLLALESRKTELLLGKIHRAIQDVARREGISVVLDKSGILYGHDAVDITDEVLQVLRGDQPERP